MKPEDIQIPADLPIQVSIPANQFAFIIELLGQQRYNQVRGLIESLEMQGNMFCANWRMQQMPKSTDAERPVPHAPPPV